MCYPSATGYTRSKKSQQSISDPIEMQLSQKYHTKKRIFNTAKNERTNSGGRKFLGEPNW